MGGCDRACIRTRYRLCDPARSPRRRCASMVGKQSIREGAGGEIEGSLIVKVYYFGARAGRGGVDREYFFVVRGSKGRA